MTFVVLQHSLDKKTLYVAVLEKPKINLPTGKKKDASVASKHYQCFLIPQNICNCFFYFTFELLQQDFEKLVIE